MPYVSYHPVYLSLTGKKVLIVGGGNVALEKLETLLPTGAEITVIAPWAKDEILAWSEEGRLQYIKRKFHYKDIDPYFMVISGTDNPAVNALVFKLGNAANKLSNSVDDPVNCNFIMSAITKRGPMQAAISSAGCSPALAQRVRKRIAEEILTDEVGTLAEYLGDWRPEVKKRLGAGYKARQAFWESVIDSDVPYLLQWQGRASADLSFLRQLESAATSEPQEEPKVGKVFLVGAGPGDPGLITVKALDALKRADIVLYDRLVNPILLRHVSHHAQTIYAGKNPGAPGQPRQDAIHDQLIHFARLGKRVVRLKGGDPFVFGRGEEALALHAAGIEFEVISGVSSAIAAPAAAGIPVTHRKVATAFAVFAGQEADDVRGDHIPWAAAALMPTCVFLMGVERLPLIAERLMEHGKSPDTPIAIISNGTLPNQKVITGRLNCVEKLAEQIIPPAAIVVGEVVTVAERLVEVVPEVRALV